MPNSGPDGEWFAITPEWWAQVQHPIVSFALWYSDGSCVRGLCSAWSDAPATGIQMLIVYHPPECLPARGLRISGRDEYTLLGQPGSKLGEMIDDTEFRRITDLAVAESRGG